VAVYWDLNPGPSEPKARDLLTMFLLGAIRWKHLSQMVITNEALSDILERSGLAKAYLV